MPKNAGYQKNTLKSGKIRCKKHRIKQKSGMGSKGENRKPKGKTKKLSYTKQ